MSGNRDESSGLPNWVLVAVAILVAGFGIFRDLLAWGLDLLPFHLGDTADSSQRSVFLIFLGLAFVILLIIFASRVLDARKAGKWKQTEARIVSAKAETVERHFDGEPPREVILPAVTYEFSVDGRTYHGNRIDVGGEGGGVDAVLARFQTGTTVPVFYDPADPGNCSLERENPTEMISGCAALIAVVAAVAVVLTWTVKSAYHVLARNPRAYPHLAIIAAIIGILGVMAFFGSRKMGRAPRIEGVSITLNSQKSVTHSPAAVASYDWAALLVAVAGFAVAVFASGMLG